MASGTRRKQVVFLLIAIILGLMLVEGAARIVELFSPTIAVDLNSPLTGQNQYPGRSTYDLTDSNTRIEILTADWKGQSVAFPRPDDELRVIVTGGSAVAGWGLARTAAFTGVLDRLLQDAAGEKRITVINLGINCYASPQITDVLRKIAPIVRPDLIVTVMGNNEYLDLRSMLGSGWLREKTFFAGRALEHNSAFARFVRPNRRPPDPTAPELPMPAMEKRDSMRKYVKRRLDRQIHQLAGVARSVDAPLLVCTVPFNKKHLPGRTPFPFRNMDDRRINAIRQSLRYGPAADSVDQLQEVVANDTKNLGARFLLAEALSKSGKMQDSLAEYEWLLGRIAENPLAADNIIMRAVALKQTGSHDAMRAFVDEAIDEIMEHPTPSGGESLAHQYWDLGQLSLIADRTDEAERFFTEASDRDPIIVRADEGINRTLLQAAADAPGATGYDLAGDFTEHSPQRIPGFELFLDYCHYNIEGNILVGHLLARQVAGILGLPGKIPPPGPALKRNRTLRAEGATDLPDWQHWAGIDFDLTRLVADRPPIIFDGLDPVAELEKRIAKQGDSALARTFLGNWKAASHLPDFKAAYEAGKKEYEAALSLDPNFEPAKNNMLYLERRAQ
jgi:tetratricopeptide (TPR) repeat protein